MARTLDDFANDMDALAERAEQFGSDAAVEAARAIVTYLAYNTPVDTSRALSNWQVSFNGAIDLQIDPHYLGSKGSTQGASAAETVRLANGILQNKIPGATIYIVNRLPYIRGLNDGTISKQPSGFVEGSLLMARQALRNFKFKG